MTDKQMNFGFTFGDQGIPEPYFYITAYPSPEALPTIQLSPGATLHSEGFTGVLLTYQTLLAKDDPANDLLELCNSVLAQGRTLLLD